ncbi:MAG: hypothetical protein Q3971_03230 [Moraxella sp.]|nr:hypothetical protein [Moraxella sp.]
MTNRLDCLQSLPCVQCQAPAPSDPCHANWGEFGKGMGIKSDDEYTIPLCRRCHHNLDTYVWQTREEAKAWFLDKWEFTNKVLDEQDNPTEPMF